jgi:hypothetical protein
VNRATKTLQLLTSFAALVGTPAIMIAGFTMFGTFSAAQFHIYDMTADYAIGVTAAFVLLALI